MPKRAVQCSAVCSARDQGAAEGGVQTGGPGAGEVVEVVGRSPKGEGVARGRSASNHHGADGSSMQGSDPGAWYGAQWPKPLRVPQGRTKGSPALGPIV